VRTVVRNNPLKIPTGPEGGRDINCICTKSKELNTKLVLRSVYGTENCQDKRDCWADFFFSRLKLLVN
jgi:hypothetical protein